VGDVLRSELLQAAGVRHGFNLRTGGVSEGAFASFNLGRAVGDDAAHVEQNHQRFAAAVGYAHGGLYEVSQVHAGHARWVSPADQPALVRREEADALVASSGEMAIGVRVADCVPVLIADASDGAVAAVHAGWRGTVVGVLEAGVHALLRAGSGDPSALRVALFPHIRRCCFEVGPDVALALSEASSAVDVVDRSRARPRVDLAAILRAKLLALGVSAGAIDEVPGCTRCEPERFFSYRRDGQQSGRHLAAIVSGSR
jgi:YfiH family protein